MHYIVDALPAESVCAQVVAAMQVHEQEAQVLLGRTEGLIVRAGEHGGPGQPAVRGLVRGNELLHVRCWIS